MKKSDKKGLVFILNIVFTLFVSYCLIKYTSLMRSDPQCRLVQTRQREILYWVGTFMIANLIVMLLVKKL